MTLTPTKENVPEDDVSKEGITGKYTTKITRSLLSSYNVYALIHS